MTADETMSAPVQEPGNAPGRAEMPVEGRAGADAVQGANQYLSWGSRSDVGLVRGHNEDSFLLRAPLFAVCDGMGGHAAGEVASSLAVDTIGRNAPGTADDTLLGAAIEAANLTVINGAENGIGKPGMGCTASAVLIEGNKMAVGHVGDSRVYLLRRGTLVRVTHDHSYVEELVDSGQITADEARVHPSRSIITRALGSDPEMYADHFSLEVANGDRIIVCSDGLSSMISDADIESVAVSAASAQQAADNLVASALTAGGSDNVTVIVVDVLNDGVAAANHTKLRKRAAIIGGVLAALVAVVAVAAVFFIRSEWYLAPDGDTVGIYQGMNGDFLGISLSALVGTSSVEVSDLPSSVQDQLARGIRVRNEDQAMETISQYRDQIDADKSKAAQTAEEAQAGSDGNPVPADVEAAPAEGAPAETQRRVDHEETTQGSEPRRGRGGPHRRQRRHFAPGREARQQPPQHRALPAGAGSRSGPSPLRPVRHERRT